MPQTTQNQATAIYQLVRQAANVQGAAETLREQASVRGIVQQHKLARVGSSGVAPGVGLLRANQNAIRGATSAIRDLQAAEAENAALSIRQATRAPWSSAAPGQRLKPGGRQVGLPTQPSNVLLDLARRINGTNQAGVVAALMGGNQRTIFDQALRGTINPQAGIAAAAVMRANPRTNVFQRVTEQIAKAQATSLAEQVVPAETITTIAQRAARMTRIAERADVSLPIANYGAVRAATQLANARTIQPYAYEGMVRRAAASLSPTVREKGERAARFYSAVEKVVSRLQGSALWFVLSPMNMGELYLFAEVEHAQAELIVLDALEAIVLEGRLVAALQTVIAKAPLLTIAQRHHLLHALGHAQRGEFLDAVPPLMCGLEGAFVSAARNGGFIDQERRLLSRPSKKLEGAGAIVKEIQLDAEFRTFLRRDVFGGLGNAFRHGDAAAGERRQALLAIVALIGWLDVFMDMSARQTLVGLLGEQLPIAVKRLPRAPASP